MSMQLTFKGKPLDETVLSDRSSQARRYLDRLADGVLIDIVALSEAIELPSGSRNTLARQLPEYHETPKLKTTSFWGNKRTIAELRRRKQAITKEASDGK